MVKIERCCLTCHSKFTAERKEVNRGLGNFCSRSCSASRPRKTKTPNSVCAYCGTSFYKRPSSITKSKSGFVFCCREHKDLAQRLNGITAIQPPHYGTGNGHKTGRLIAIRHLPHQCNRCGYDRDIRILEVHHIDRDPSNNQLDNLEILCPNCHTIEHLM